MKWFGYKLHLIADATYELPVMFSVTKASEHDINMLAQMEKKQPAVLETTDTMAADKAYDNTKLITTLWDQYKIKPIIDIRNMWKDEDKKQVLESKENVVYDYKRAIFCVGPETGVQREMCNGGFEKDRNTLKKLCLAKQYGTVCKGQAKCPVAQGIRIPLSEDRRIFSPIDRSSCKWEKAYDKRTVVERMNGRLDVSFGFELHTIRGMAKMKMRCPGYVRHAGNGTGAGQREPGRKDAQSGGVKRISTSG